MHVPDHRQTRHEWHGTSSPRHRADMPPEQPEPAAGPPVTVLFVDKTGQVSCLDGQPERIDLTTLGRQCRQRASHVEPVNRVLRMVFRMIRLLAGGNEQLVNSTRIWCCRWRARIIGGPVLGPFNVRSLALDAERAWLNNNLPTLRRNK